MTLFSLLALALVGAVLALLLPALLQSTQRPPPAQATSPALAILREQQAQLQAEHASGHLSALELAQAQQELARRVVEENSDRLADEQPARRNAPWQAGAPSRATAWGVALLLPLLAAGLYARLGEPQALNLAPAAAVVAEAPLAAGASPSGTDVSMIQVEAMVAQMAERLEKQPPSQATAEGWQMLARSLAALQRFPEADRAYQRAIDLAPRNPNLLADRADLLVLLQDQGQDQGKDQVNGQDKGQGQGGEADRLIARALQIDPQHPKALALAGSAAMARRDWAGALAFWQRARAQVPAGSDFANDLDRNLAAVQQQLGEPALGSAPAAGASVAAAGASLPSQPVSKPAMGGSLMASASLSGTVQLAPALQAQLKPGDTLFVYARAAQGPRLPLAVLRVPAGRFPMAFTLDDTLAMSPDWRLSAVPQVVVEARVSRSGNAMPQAGDLVGRSAVVANRGSGLTLVIDQVQP